MLQKIHTLFLLSKKCSFHLSRSFPSKQGFENALKILNLVTELDRKNLVVKLEKKDLIAKYSAGGTKGGQKANKSHSLVNLKHVPTGLTASGKETRQLPTNYNFALAKLKMAVDMKIKGEESMFVIIKKQEEEKARQTLEIKRMRKLVKQQNEEKLKVILSEEDTLLY